MRSLARVSLLDYYFFRDSQNAIQKGIGMVFVFLWFGTLLVFFGMTLFSCTNDGFLVWILLYVCVLVVVVVALAGFTVSQTLF